MLKLSNINASEERKRKKNKKTIPSGRLCKHEHWSIVNQIAEIGGEKISR